MISATLHLRIIVTDPPPDTYNGKPAIFGLQDKNGALTPGAATPDGNLLFECDLKVSGDGDFAKLTGQWAHGTPQDRFLYLGYRLVDSQAWIFRIKVPVSAIPMTLINESSVLETTVDGRKPARAKVNWTAK